MHAWRRILPIILVCLGSCTLASSASAVDYPPVDQPGPKLSVPRAQLQQSLHCTDGLGSAQHDPVLFVPPTLVNPDEAYFPYYRALDAMGIPYCTVTIPNATTEDIQASGEYVVNAIRAMHRQTRRQIDLLGWSQGGGPEPRWALRFWPDIRPMVAKLIDLEAPNHGTVILHTMTVGGISANPLCPGHCVPAIWQQAAGSQFTAALNSGQETFPGIAYTNVYSHTSQFVQPNLDDSGTTSLHGGGGQVENIATQDICPLNAADHLAYWYDPVAFAIVVDALTHSGPADPARISRSVCLRVTNPYVSITQVPTYTAYLYQTIFVDRFFNEPQVSGEPALRCYVTASCAEG
jgi:triacylglycerol esterase/lipase EstA (alpha/beta hydrolase family)